MGVTTQLEDEEEPLLDIENLDDENERGDEMDTRGETGREEGGEDGGGNKGRGKMKSKGKGKAKTTEIEGDENMNNNNNDASSNYGEGSSSGATKQEKEKESMKEETKVAEDTQHVEASLGYVSHLIFLSFFSPLLPFQSVC